MLYYAVKKIIKKKGLHGEPVQRPFPSEHTYLLMDGPTTIHFLIELDTPPPLKSFVRPPINLFYVFIWVQEWLKPSSI